MAKATANCTCATCGKAFEKEVEGRNRKDADNKAEWAAQHFDECPICYHARIERERQEAHDTAEKEAKDAGLPDLVGSEKQVAWATTIRHTCYSKASEALSGAEKELEKRKTSGKDTTRTEKRIDLYRDFARFLLSHTAAHWWIDNREKAEAYSFMDVRLNFEREFDTWREAHKDEDVTVTASQEKVSDEIRKAAEAEMIAAPENQTHRGAVEITVTETAVSARYEKDDDFRNIVKRLGFRWNADRRAWEKVINIFTGTAQERAAELGSNLLNEGFAVQIADPETRSAAVEGRYTPEHRRWVSAYNGGDYNGWFCISLPERGDGMYEKAKRISGARYHKPNVAVPAKRWQEVLDFAELNDYRISPGAEKLIAAQKEAVIVVSPAPVKAAVYEEHDPAEILGGDAGVLGDLVEDD